MSWHLCVPGTLCLWTRGSSVSIAFFLLASDCLAFETELSGIPSAVGVRKSEWYFTPVGKMKYFLPIGMTHETRHVTYLWASLISQFRLFLSRYWRAEVKKIHSIKGDHTFFYHGDVYFYLFLWIDKIRSLQIKLFFRKMLAVRKREIKENITLLGHLPSHSGVLAWRIPGRGEPGGLPSMESHRVGHDWSDLAAAAAAGHQGVPSSFLLMCSVFWISNNNFSYTFF